MFLKMVIVTKLFFKYFFSLLNFEANIKEMYSREILNLTELQNRATKLLKLVYRTTKNGTLITRPYKTVHSFRKTLGQLPATLLKLSSSVVCETWFICSISTISLRKWVSLIF